ncbi:serine hydrolase domain-containing protein [Arenimonas composti]|uniref:Beta-lactamase-related domain-containing protein n=1 Tax=Arenimonas composti TR7-09 = DSM 18010 TaxID=1121013 RepID=A0A091BWJ8_9GAMM|nr:serine hydrolase domain-containing protein [Arenimonas composti]KFN48720.1 hypothetical protein P873_13770 [Arenimonas composti TR7-09 = DSM 18010]
MSLRLLVFVLSLAAGTQATAQAPDFGGVDALAERAVADGSTPSLVVAVARDGEVLYARGFGFADVEAGTPATPDTAFPLASLTKPLTATAVMAVVQRKGLDLDTPVMANMPEHAHAPVFVFRDAAGHARDVSLRQLLGHTAGLATYARIHYGDARPGPPLMAQFARYGTLVATPGRVAEYANLGYGLLGEFVAIHARRDFADAMAAEVFAPLAMTNSFIGEPEPGRDAAVRYGSDGARLPPLHNDTPGAGNGWASARDLLRFADFHLRGGEGPRLDRATVARMQQVADPGAFQHVYGDAAYGLGWYLRRTGDGRREVWHEGGMPGASSLLRLDPEHGIAIVVLANRSDVNALTQALADAALVALLPAAQAEALVPVAAYAPFTGQDGFPGRWRGEVHVDGRALPASLELRADGSGALALPGADGEDFTAEFGAMVNGDIFIAALPGRLPARDLAAGETPLLLLKLVRSGDRLDGAVVAYASPARLDHLLPFAIVLRRDD